MDSASSLVSFSGCNSGNQAQDRRDSGYQSLSNNKYERKPPGSTREHTANHGFGGRALLGATLGTRRLFENTVLADNANQREGLNTPFAELDDAVLASALVQEHLTCTCLTFRSSLQ